MSDDSNGRPQPASGPMDKATADWYVRHTDGQFQAFLGDGDKWYLYTPSPMPASPHPNPTTEQ
jgi:hypothetical protein